MYKSVFVLSSLLILIAGCSKSTEPDIPDWVDNLIVEFSSREVGNPPQSIWQYEYKNRIVYYVPPQCCDQFSTLYDAEGNILGAPDGGITGAGDGRFPDFMTERKNEKLIWRDPRK